MGWKTGTVAEFLGLTPEEEALIEIKLALSKSLRERRQRQMAELAAKIHSSQSRIARAESGHSSVSLDLLIRALLATGATVEEIGNDLAAASR